MICREAVTIAIIMMGALAWYSQYVERNLPENTMASCPPTMMFAERDLSGATPFVAMDNVYVTENGSACRI